MMAFAPTAPTRLLKPSRAAAGVTGAPSGTQLLPLRGARRCAAHGARVLVAPGATRMLLSEGSRAPTFSATDIDGKPHTLSSLRGDNDALVLYFSNLSGPGCQSQSRAFRRADAELRALGARISAVSAQRDDGAARAFRDANELPFIVLSDSDGRLARLFDVPATMGLLPGRVTFVIGADDVVRRVFNSQFSVERHVEVAKEELRRLGK